MIDATISVSFRDIPARVAEIGADLARVGAREAVVRGAPLRYRLEPLALVARKLEVAGAHAEHAHLGRLDHGDAAVVVVEHEKALADFRQLVSVALVVDEQTGRRGLLAPAEPLLRAACEAAFPRTRTLRSAPEPA